MSPDDLIRLRHMAEAARAALCFCQGRARADLETDAMLRFAPTQALQVVGEAAPTCRRPAVRWRPTSSEQ